MDAGIDEFLRSLALAAEYLEHACFVLVRYADEHEMLAVFIIIAEHIRYRRADRCTALCSGASRHGGYVFAVALVLLALDIYRLSEYDIAEIRSVVIGQDREHERAVLARCNCGGKSALFQ